MEVTEIFDRVAGFFAAAAVVAFLLLTDPLGATSPAQPHAADAPIVMMLTNVVITVRRRMGPHFLGPGGPIRCACQRY